MGLLRLSHKGFTLMELMITVVVLGILAAIALPSFQSILEGRRLVGAADDLYSNLQFARSEAIKRNETIRFQITTGANWCFGVDDDDGVVCDCNASACEIDGVLKNVTSAIYPGIQMSTGGVIEFNSRQGMPAPPNAQDFTFRVGATGRVKTVSVNAIGLVTVN
jgi:type IV fimbrial biogenesis protein FimT